jgi:rare lipoprotein A
MPPVVRILLLAAALMAAAFAPAEAPAGAYRLTQTGLASYYGPGFQGDTAASGERFDQRKLVAAHRRLPFGTTVRVTNLENGRSVVVRIIDRGPYGRNHRKGCIIDLSKAAARRIRSVQDGIVRVRVRVLRLGRSG